MTFQSELMGDDIPHGTVEGYDLGCRGGACPAVISCEVVKIRYAGDWGFRKAVDAGVSLTEIIARDAAEAHARSPHKSTSAYMAKPPVSKQAIAELNAAGLNDRQIADRLGYHQNTIGDHRRAMGLPANLRAYTRATS